MDSLLALARAEVLWIVVTLSLGAGLIGAYGRERHEGRLPTGSWWLTRLCIMPFLAIVVAFCTDQFTLTRQQAALLSALLALMGYEAVRVILDRASKRGGALIDTIIPATAKPYTSMIDSDDAGRTTAHLMMTPGSGSAQDVAGAALHEAYDRAVVEPLDEATNEILRKLD